MSDRSSFQALFLAATLFLAASLATPQILHAGAIGQLEGLTGAKIIRFQKHGMGRMPSSMKGAPGGMMMMSSILGVAMQGMMNAAINAQVRAQQKAQFEEMQRWMAAEQERLSQLVSQQRRKRDAESQAGLQEMAKAMSDQWDSGKKPPDLSSALSDPQVVDLRPQGTPFFGEGGGDSSVVDLRDRKRDTPQIPDGKRPPAQVAAKPVPQSETTRKLQKMIQENQDPAKLNAKLKNLEDKLAKASNLSAKIKEGAPVSPQDLQAWDQSLGQAAQEGMLRGLSLAMDFRGDLASNRNLLSWYQGMKANPARMKQFLDAMGNINDFAEFANYYHESKSGELKDIIWSEANRNLMRDLDFFRTQNTISPDQYRNGKNMIKESVSLAEGREEMGKIEVRVKIKGLSPFFWDRKKQLDQQAQRLAETTRAARQGLALKKDLPATPGKPDLASSKPSPASSPGSAIPVMDNVKVIPLDLKQPSEKPAPATKSTRLEPPLPGPKYRTVVFQGVVGSKQEDRELMKAIQNSPLFQNHDQSYVFAFPGGPQSDRLMYHPESNPDLFFKKFPEIKKMEAEKLVFTGNLAPMVELFIRERYIKAKHLVFITKDTSHNYPKLVDLMTLAQKRGIWFSWYLHQDGKLVVFKSPSGINRNFVRPDF